MAVGIYLRVSTEEQRERQSIATQRDFAERYCSLHGLTVACYYTDDGISGTLPLESRPEAGRILQDARLGRFDQLLIFKLDRLGRETRLILNAVAELEKCGVRVRSMTEEFDTATATGRLMLTMLSGFAAHEREQIRERSLAGTNRMAEAGAWLGGIVPYGYRKQGERREARLAISREPVAGLGISEEEVILSIYRMAAVERKSCRKIAEWLNEMGVPCAYVRDERLLSTGKRLARTSGLWRPSRVRNLIVSATYMGRHEYGKRTRNSARTVIARSVPAIVSEEVWRKAQLTLKSNFVFGKRNARNQYLLRSLIKCGLCHLTYVGTAQFRSSGKRDFYYRCNGKQNGKGLYGPSGQRCPSKDVNGDYLEAAVWTEVESFLRNPGEVLDLLRQRMAQEAGEAGSVKERHAQLERALTRKTAERNRVLALFRRGRIDDKTLDEQMDQIGAEEAALASQIEEIRNKLRGIEGGASKLSSTEDLLRKLRARLDEPLSWELKRQLIEVLVGAIRVDTTRRAEQKESVVTVTYRFASSIDTCTDTRACINRTLERVYRPPRRWAA